MTEPTVPEKTVLGPLDIRRVMAAIPHRYPMLLVDRVEEIIPDRSITAIKAVSINEGFFNGHFPGRPIMPGVLIIEAMAQAGCIYFYYSKNMQGKELLYYLAKVEAKFIAPVIPGDQLRIEVSTVKLMSKVGFLNCKAFVKDKLVAEAEIGFGIKEL